MFWAYVIAGFLAALVGVGLFFRRFFERAAGKGADVPPEHLATVKIARAVEPSIPFTTEALDAAHTSIYKLAFGAARVDYDILGEHRRVLSAIQEAVTNVTSQARYFPRKPALLPKLLRAINAMNSSRNEIVRLILQDAVLAGNVLQRANSVYYNHGKEVIESIDRAVTILGNEGLRAPVASAVMQPVFQVPSGFFEQFAPITWELARRTALSAEEFARRHRSADAFVAHLAGMLDGLGRIVLFRLTMDKYRERGNLMPRVEVFVRVMQDHSQQVARAIADAWELSEQFLEAFDAQLARVTPERMTPLARALYYAQICGALATLNQHGSMETDEARQLLSAQGLDQETFKAVWTVAVRADAN